MSEFIVKIVEKDKVGLWHDFWDSKTPSDAAKQANRDGSLGQTKHVKAKNIADACDIVERDNPGFVAIRDATQRLG